MFAVDYIKPTVTHIIVSHQSSIIIIRARDRPRARAR